MNILCLQIKSGLDHWTLRGQHHHLIILIVERRTDAPGITYGKHLARACESAHHVAGIVVFSTFAIST